LEVRLERQSELKDSVQLARTRFLMSVRKFRPHVGFDLYTSTFAPFVFAVAEHFKDELLQGNRETETEAFLDLTNSVIDGIEDKHEPAWLTHVDPDTRALIDQHRLTVVVAHLRGRIVDPPLVELASLPLMRVIGTLMRLGSSVIEKAFSDWKSIKASSHTRDLAYEIEAWSLRWNLNADWCRDHALKLLCHWLLDDPLRWTFLDALGPTRNPRLAELWHFVTKDKEFDVGWSQATLSDEVFQGNPEDFVFEDEALPLKYDGYNPIVQNLAEWKRKVELDFRIRLYEAELNRLRQIKSQTDKADSLENGFKGMLGLFRTAMNEHIAQSEAKVATAEELMGLVRVVEKREADKHLEWVVRYQIPTNREREYEFEYEYEIADHAGVGEPAVSKAITGILREIGLPIRLKTPKTDQAMRIAQQLNKLI
jgi:hypothetical protein